MERVKILRGTIEAMEIFNEMERDELFIYEQCGTFPAFKINNGYAALINAEGKFVLAKKYKNCLSIGSEDPLIFATYADVKTYLGCNVVEHQPKHIVAINSNEISELKR